MLGPGGGSPSSAAGCGSSAPPPPRGTAAGAARRAGGRPTTGSRRRGEGPRPVHPATNTVRLAARSATARASRTVDSSAGPTMKRTAMRSSALGSANPLVEQGPGILDSRMVERKLPTSFGLQVGPKRLGPTGSGAKPPHAMESCAGSAGASIGRRCARRLRRLGASDHRLQARPERRAPPAARRVRFIGWAPQQNRSQVAVADKCEPEPATQRPPSDTATVWVRGARGNPGFRKCARRAGRRAAWWWWVARWRFAGSGRRRDASKSSDSCGPQSHDRSATACRSPFLHT